MKITRCAFAVGLVLPALGLALTMSGCGGSRSVSGLVNGPGPDFANSGFETPNLGAGVWVYEPSGFVWAGTPNGWGMGNQATSWGAAHTGNQFAFMQGVATLSQTVSGLTIGNRYQVTFWCCTRDGDVGGNTTEPIGVLANGTPILTPFNPAAPGQWTEYATEAYTATSTSVTFSFQTQDPTGQDCTDLLDDVHLVEVK
jgi:hypothetical protein